MKIELPCAVVRDLLPSYVEGLTEDETTTAVQSHLETCESCRRHYEAMSGGDAAPAADTKEVDYLKTIRKKNRKKMVLAVVLAVILALGAVGIKLCLIGSPATAGSFEAHVQQEDFYPNNVTVNLFSMDSAAALIDLKSHEEDGIIDITGRKALVSPFHRNSDHSLTLNVEGIREIRAFGELIWRDGTGINSMTRRLMRHKTPYTGEASAIGQLLSDMDMDSAATLELQTAKEPYGVTIHFTNTIAENRHARVEGHAYVLLALVENMGEVRWDDPSGYTGFLTLEQANAALSDLVEAYNHSHNTDLVPLSSVKDYGADGYQLQILQNILGF